MVIWTDDLKKYMEMDDVPLYIRIYRGIKEIACMGKLKDGDKILPVRELAARLGVNTGTVARAYQKLKEEGWIYTRTGGGTFIRNRKGNPYETAFDSFKQWFMGEERDTGGESINFATTTPSPDFFPVESFKEALNYVLDRDRGSAFVYHESQGYYPLREAICEYLAGYGVNARPDDVQITTGAQQGIDLVAKALIEDRDVVYLERPSYPGAMAAFAHKGAILVDVPMDEEGMDLNVLENYVKKKHPRFVYIMPNFQSPTGICYSKRRRKELLYLAERYRFYLVEDDYLGELSFNGQYIYPIKAFDTQDLVIYLKSFSKIFMPGLRLGFMVIPEDIRRRIGDAKQYSDICTSGLIQRVFDFYLRRGHWRRYLEYLKAIYRKRHDCMCRILDAYPSIFRFHPPGGGLAFWISLPEEWSGYKIARMVASKKVYISPGEMYYINGGKAANIRLGYASVDEEYIVRGIEVIADLVKTKI